MRCFPKIRFVLFALGLLVGAAFTAQGQWPTDPITNLAIADQAGRQVLPIPTVISDGGCYVGWFDNTSGNYDVYLQRLDRNGYEQWPHNGILVSGHSQLSSLVAWDMMTDSNDNAILVFSDSRAGSDLDIYAYKVSPSGEMLWGMNGVTLSTNNDYEPGASVAEATDGDLVFVWASLPDPGDRMIRMQRLSPEGIERFAHNGLAIVSPAGETPAFPDVVASLDGSVITSWVRDISQYMSPRHIRANRFAVTGAALWPAPVDIFDAVPVPLGYQPRIQSDGAGGAVCAWHASMSGFHSSRFQHLDADGLELLTHNGVAVSTASMHHIDPTLAYHPGTHEAFIFWNERNSGQTAWGIYGQRISRDGIRLWGDSGVAHLPVNTIYKSYPRAVACSGGAMVFFAEAPTGFYDVRLLGMRVEENGAMAWAGSPIEVSSLLGEKARYPVIINDQEMAVLVWEDDRTGTVDLYGQNVNADGTLGVSPGGVTPAAAHLCAPGRSQPNPFLGSTQFVIPLPRAVAGARMLILDAGGRRLRSLALGDLPAGEWRFTWNAAAESGGRLPAGVYLYRVVDRQGTTAGGGRVVLLNESR